MVALRMAPHWNAFPVIKHGPADLHLSGLYCLSACMRWFHRLDDHPPTAAAILKRMRATVPTPPPRSGLTEIHLRHAGNLHGLHLYRPNVDDLLTLDWPASWIWIAAVRSVPVPRRRESPEGRRYVLVLGLPDNKSRFLIADPHPDAPTTYWVPLEAFKVAWEAAATARCKPWSGVVGRLGP